MIEFSQPFVWLLAMISILPLVARCKDNLLAWAIVVVGFFCGQQAFSMATGTSLLLAYAMIDGIAGVLVQRPSRWPFTFMGSAYGTMGLSHVALHFGLIEPAAHNLIGNATGWLLFGLLTFLGIWDGGHRDRSNYGDAIRGRVAHAGAANEKAS